jgi:hypothetical protein
MLRQEIELQSQEGACGLGLGMEITGLLHV